MLIDTHCHLNFKAFDKDLPQVIERAKKAGVEKIIIPGAKIDSSNKAVEIAKQYQSCYAAIGIHPHHADAAKESKEILLSLTQQAKVMAIGEIGLDYYTYHNHPPPSAITKKIQAELLLFQLELAYKSKLPVIIHCREAFSALLALMSSFVSQHSIKGVFHCFTGTKEDLTSVLNLGFYVGFDGNITYEENQNLRDLVKLTPLDRLLLETDAPFLAPLPYRKQRNEPSLLVHVAQMVAEIQQKPLDLIAKSTFHNAIELFKL